MRVAPRACLAAALCALAFVWAAAAAAQDGVDFEAWSRTAARAEAALETGQASDAALESLRGQIAAWRETLLDVEGQNGARIRTLEAQITALGPAPDPADESATEAADVAARRAELNEQLARLRAPVVAAQEAYRRADGLIREIDDLIRSRRTGRLLELQASPLDPARWGVALNELTDEITKHGRK